MYRPIIMVDLWYYNQSGVTEQLIMVGCVLSQLKPSELYILSCGKGLGLQLRPFFTAKSFGLYPMHILRHQQ